MRMSPGLPLKSVIVIGLVIIFLGLRVSAGFSAPALPEPDSLVKTSEPDRNEQARQEIEAASSQGNSLNEQQAIPYECGVSEKYPQSIQQWCSLITQHAVKNQLDPDLLAALIWQESGGDPVAYSHSGAVGLMQVMPRDGLAADFQCINGPCFRNRPSIQELQDADFNITYGTTMLAGLYQKHGSLRDALLSYGPMDVGYYYADKVLGIYENYKK